MRQDEVLERARYWLFRDRIPVTKALIVTNILTFLVLALSGSGVLAHYLGFTSLKVFSMPWTLFTYPLLGSFGVISLLFAGYWLWVAGGSLERAWGSQTFAAYFFIMSAVTALGLYIGGVLGGTQVYLANIWLPLAGVTVAFAMSNPEQEILFFFVIPMKLKYLALLDVAIVFVTYAQGHPLLGVFALVGCGASYWYVRSGQRMIAYRSPSRPERGQVIRMRRPETETEPRRSLNPIKWYQERRRRKQVEDLFKRSGFGD